MPRTPKVPSFWWLAGPLLAALACSHDSPRDNPLDPTLTPPVQLQVALDSTAGTATLTWTRYEGEAEFGEYWVLRKVPGLEAVDTLITISDMLRTTWVDTSLSQHTVYEYRVSAVNAGHYEATPGPQTVGPMRLPPVEIVSVEFDSRSASATLTWTQYRGPHFQAYEVRRHSAGLESHLVTTVSDRDRTSTVDVGLHGNTEYTHQVVVLTETGEEIRSVGRSGRFHALVGTWPLDLDEGTAVRLRTTVEDRVEALVSSENEVRLLEFDTGGSVRKEQELYAKLGFDVLYAQLGIVVQSVATAAAEDGRRFLALAHTNRAMVMAMTPGGEVIRRSTTLFDVELPQGVSPVEEIGLEVPNVTDEGVGAGDVVGTAGMAFDNVEVYSAGRLVLEEGFEAGMPGDWEVDYNHAGNRPDPYEGTLIFQALSEDDGRQRARRGDPSWQEPGVQADMWMVSGGGGVVAVGKVGGHRVLFRLAEHTDTARLWVTTDPDRGIEEWGSVHFGLWSWVRYRMGLWVQGGRVTAAVEEPFIWFEESDEAPGWGSIALVGDHIAFTSGNGRHALAEDAGLTQSEQTASATSDMRVWQSGDDTWMALCVPDENRVIVGRPSVSSFSGQFTFPAEGARSTVALGSGAGHQEGRLFFPISAGHSDDGRHYVLDAGNARIQVFDEKGEYLTQWGTPGSGPGQFDFGTGNVSTDFAGSICVDDEGYIYVADVGNKRIQKFSP